MRMYFNANGLFTEKHAAALIRSMLRAVKQCHDSHVIHRDVKPENFLMHTGEGMDTISCSLSLLFVNIIYALLCFMP